MESPEATEDKGESQRKPGSDAIYTSDWPPGGRQEVWRSVTRGQQPGKRVPEPGLHDLPVAALRTKLHLLVKEGKDGLCAGAASRYPWVMECRLPGPGLPAGALGQTL